MNKLKKNIWIMLLIYTYVRKLNCCLSHIFLGELALTSEGKNVIDPPYFGYNGSKHEGESNGGNPNPHLQWSSYMQKLIN